MFTHSYTRVDVAASITRLYVLSLVLTNVLASVVIFNVPLLCVYVPENSTAYPEPASLVIVVVPVVALNSAPLAIVRLPKLIAPVGAAPSPNIFPADTKTSPPTSNGLLAPLT